MMPARQIWVIAHRWAGLTIALFLTIAGATGTLLAFYDELDTLAAPGIHNVAPPTRGGAVLDPLALRNRVLAAYPGGVINYLPLHSEPGQSLKLEIQRVDPASGTLRPWSEEWDEVFVDPYTGETLGRRQWGDIGQGMINLMPFLYRLHYSLALGDYGVLAFGIAALIWTLDCFVGFYLTVPRRQRRRDIQPPRRALSWWSRWRPAWLVRWRGGRHKLAFDLHRAGGLWVWPLLMVFAWSGVSFNLTQVYSPVMKLFGYERLQDGIVPPPTPRLAPRLDFEAAVAVGQRLAQQETVRLGLTIDPSREAALFHRPDAGVYVYIFTSSADFRTDGGRSLAIFDSDTGRLRKLVLPQGQNGANTLTEWLTSLHMGAVWGVPWRIAVSLIGLMVTMLSVTGVLIWVRKRSARILRKERALAALPA